MTSGQSRPDLTGVVTKNISFYHSIKPKVEKDSYTVIATLNDAASLELLALATGTQANLKQYDNDIEDCHAESLLKRAYKRYVIDKLLAAIRSGTQSDVAQCIEEIHHQELILFVSQFPCGLIKRFEGAEPIDEETGATVIRKPGRGQVVDGKVVYVRRDNCLNKLQKWISSHGFLGRSLGSKLGLSSNLKYVLIGDCEPDSTLDYESCLDSLTQRLSGSKCQSIQCELVRMREEEFTFDSGDKLPLPVATVWWAPATGKASVRDTLEYVVDGRRIGITKKQSASNNVRLKLRSSDFWLREDLKQISIAT